MTDRKTDRIQHPAGQNLQRKEFIWTKPRKPSSAWKPPRRACCACIEQFIDRKTGNARHRRDGVAAVFALLDKNRQDQIVRRKRRFTDESAGKAVMTVAAHAHHRKLTKSLHRIASKVLEQERPGAGCAALDASIGISRKDQRPSHPSRVARSSSTPVFFSPEKYCTETGFTQVSARFFTAAITSRRSETVLN